jgi:hypothetical protein
LVTWRLRSFSIRSVERPKYLADCGASLASNRSAGMAGPVMDSS